MNRVRFGFSVLTALLAAAAPGCSGGRSASSGASSNPAAPAGSSTGTVRVLLTANAAPKSVQSLAVNFDRVTVYPSGGGAMPLVEQGPIDLALNNASVDVAKLTGGATTVLASGIAVSGDYDRVEVSVASATVTLTGGEDRSGGSLSMRVRSNVVDVPASFTVAGGGTVHVVLDFDTGGSVQIGSGTPTLQPRLSLSVVR
jgi:hypothetical protein